MKSFQIVINEMKHEKFGNNISQWGSAKYDVMRFKIPNIVVVFSNHLPNTRELSKDRWKIFRIITTGLKNITINVWKAQHGDKSHQNNLQKDDENDEGCYDNYD